MSILTPASHHALQLACRRADRRFSQERFHLERIQREKLQQILNQAVWPAGQHRPRTYEEFAAALPLTRYRDWKPRIEAMRDGDSALSKSPLVRFQPTSGSSESIKFIPYTKQIGRAHV